MEDKEVDIIVKRHVTVYRVSRNSDLTEGRGSQIHIGDYETEMAADDVAHGRGVQGGPADVRAVSEDLVIIEGIPHIIGDEVMSADRAKEIEYEQAMSKLTARDREVLGLNK